MDEIVVVSISFYFNPLCRTLTKYRRSSSLNSPFSCFLPGCSGRADRESKSVRGSRIFFEEASGFGASSVSNPRHGIQNAPRESSGRKSSHLRSRHLRQEEDRGLYQGQELEKECFSFGTLTDWLTDVLRQFYNGIKQLCFLGSF